MLTNVYKNTVTKFDNTADSLLVAVHLILHLHLTTAIGTAWGAPVGIVPTHWLCGGHWDSWDIWLASGWVIDSGVCHVVRVSWLGRDGLRSEQANKIQSKLWWCRSWRISRNRTSKITRWRNGNI